MTGIRLRGMTWDHARGFDPMVATAAEYARRHPTVEIAWEKRSLQAFADRPIGAMADDYDLMVIDHPHVGEASRAGLLVALDEAGREAELAALAAASVGLSHPSYAFDGHQWALAIDAATPVAAFRPDRLDAAPREWAEVRQMAEAGNVAFALAPINALMCFFGLARNLGFAIAEHPERLIDPAEGAEALDQLLSVARLVPGRCLTSDPIAIYDWMSGTEDAPVYSPFGYGYTNYSRDGYAARPLVFADAPGIDGRGPRGTVLGGTGIAVSARSRHREAAIDYVFWVAGAEVQRGLYFASGGQPGHAAAWDDEACNAGCRDFFRNTRATLETAWLRPRYDGYMRLQNAGSVIVHGFLTGDLGAGAALARLDSAYRESRT